LAKAGASSYNFHFEATSDPLGLIETIRGMGMKAGMAIKPATSITEITHLLDKLDYILVMTVEPGFGGQKLLVNCIHKVYLS